MKKALLLAALTAAAIFSLPFGARAEEDTAVLPILMYHEVKPVRSGKDAILPSELEDDLRYLTQAGFTAVTVEDAIDFVYGEAGLPEKPVMLTFDDAYLNNYLYALPLIEKYQTPVVLSVLGKNTDDFTQFPSASVNYAHLTWDQLKKMAATGLVELQNHSYDLHGMKKGRMGCLPKQGESAPDYEKLLMQDVGGLQEEMFDRLGLVPRAFTYPYGKYCELSEGVLREELGFEATLSCDWGVNVLTRDPDCLFCLKRICRSHGHGARELLAAALRTV